MPRMTKCKTCPARIFWAVTLAGKSTPMDSEPDPEGGWVIDGQADEGAPRIRQHEPMFDAGADRFQPHWATCPNADQHRRPK